MGEDAVENRRHQSARFSSLGTADLSRAAQGIKRGQLDDAKQMN